VIHLLPSGTLDDRFLAQDLPDALQLPLLNSIVVPRVMSSSMTPTIQEGDRLELSPPTPLAIGAIVVFRSDTMLVCHRITAIDPQGTLSTRGDATQGACEVVHPNSVIGIVTGVMRKSVHISLGQSLHIPSAAVQSTRLTSPSWNVVTKLVITCLHVFARFSLFQHMFTILLRWAATVDVLTPAPLRSLPSNSTIDSFPLRLFPHIAGLIAASDRQKPLRYIIRLGSWRLAHYDPATASLLLRQSLRDAGLESVVRRNCGAHHIPSE
jgi:signal peptidase I